MIKSAVEEEYFEWLYNLIRGDRYSERTSYRKLLLFLHDTEFRWSIAKDRNRAEDGLDLRCRFSSAYGYESYYLADQIQGPCSVFEMMAALAIRCEETIMDDPKLGNRTGQWFWGMINSLGLGGMIDSRFDAKYVGEVVERFLNRKYERNGRGGLFTIKNCDSDLRRVEIWYQLSWYLDSIMGY